jgi:hypothetical protein
VAWCRPEAVIVGSPFGSPLGCWDFTRWATPDLNLRPLFVSGKDSAEVRATGMAVTSRFILQQSPLQPTKTAAHRA